MAIEVTQRFKGIVLIVTGLITCFVGFYVGNKVVPDKVLDRIKGKLCIHSRADGNYANWVGSLARYSNNMKMKITYWNLTNKEGFLYRGEKPIVKEVGPYVYLFSSMKTDIVFSPDAHTVKYKSLTNTKFDSLATTAACRKCTEADKITIPNTGYIGLMINSNGDKNLAVRFVPGAASMLIGMALSSGFTRNETLKQFGNFSSTLLSTEMSSFPVGWFPAGFASWFALQNKTKSSPLYGSLRNTNRTGYSLGEMTALYDVILSSDLLGVYRNATRLSICTVNPSSTGCGYLIYFKAYYAVQSHSPKNDSLLEAIQKRIQELFCPTPSKCLFLDQSTFQAIPIYITDHLAKLAIHIATDKHDFGPLMTRTVKQISHGFVETNVKIPPLFSLGFPINGFLPLETINTNTSKKASSREYTCNDVSMAFQIKEIEDNEFVNAAYYPNASKEFRKIQGYTKVFGYKAITPCTNKQPAGKSSYTLFDTKLKLKSQLVKKGNSMVGPIYTYKYEENSQALFRQNNISVFRNGLIDISRAAKGVPLVASMPHFLFADADLVKRFGTMPVQSLHNSEFYIEPLSGIAIKLKKRNQINVALPEITVQSPRQPPFNITYKEKQGSSHYSNVIPIFWLEVDVEMSAESASSLSGIYKGIQGACVSLVLGPLLGGFNFILGMIYLIKSFKNQIHHQVSSD